MKGESEKAGLKVNIQKTKILASGPITLWQIDGETMGTVIDFILGSYKVTVNMLSRFTLPTKVHLVKAMVIPVVMYGCES